MKLSVYNKARCVLFVAAFIFPLAACNSIAPKSKVEPSQGHIQQNRHAGVAGTDSIPEPVSVSPTVPLPKPKQHEPTHTVIVTNVSVKELLFSIARDANLNLDIDEDVDGRVTLNAIDQPLSALLERIVETTDLTYEIKNDVLRIKKDKPYLKNYRVDYINMSRSSVSSSQVSTQISATGQGAGSSSAGGGSNNSSTEVTNKAENAFWDSLSRNIEGIIYVEPEVITVTDEEGEESESQAEPAATATDSDIGNPNIIVNKESGILNVRATRKQHLEIEKFLNEIQFSTRRQVLIEATIAEVKLSDSYQAGIDWQLVENNLTSTTLVGQTLTDINLFDRPTFTMQYSKNDNGDTLQGTLSALETFGDVSIMSSPKVMALNNQTALLKVVDNIVYFNIEVNIETTTLPNGSTGIGFITYETEVNTVPVGFVMSVTPFINESNSVTLNVRPTISRVIGQARDPNPALADAGVISEIPVIQVREVESVLKVSSGDIAVMGGLMQDEINKSKRGVPVLGRIPFVGPLFRYDDETVDKTELVIFIRPVVINHASIDTDLSEYQRYLPQR
ncbi:Type II secretion system protein D [Thalassocella blandensis]|nr:Type II secretion system protein D [Thalassocella blandensis]